MIRRAPRLDTDPERAAPEVKRFEIARNECSACGALNPTPLGSPSPATCAVCGSRIQNLKENANVQREYDRRWRERRRKFRIG